jgi:hypothetical protein
MKFSFTKEQASAYIAQHMSHSFAGASDLHRFAKPSAFSMKDSRVETGIDVARYAKPTPFSMEQSN